MPCVLPSEQLGIQLVASVLVDLQCSYPAVCPGTVPAGEPVLERAACLCPACAPRAAQLQLLGGLSKLFRGRERGKK